MKKYSVAIAPIFMAMLLHAQGASLALPPKPDPKINNATLLGIDANKNGIRDDVERWIYTTYSHPIERTLSLQEAKVQQINLRMSAKMQSDKEVALDFKRNHLDKYIACELYWKYESKDYMLPEFSRIKGYTSEHFSKPLEDKLFNTKQRRTASTIYEKALSGKVCHLVEPNKIHCAFDGEALLKEHK